MSVYFVFNTHCKRMRSYKYNPVHTTSFACSTGTSTISYDWPAQCYCRLLSTDGCRGLRDITNDRTFIHAVGCNLEDCSQPVLPSTLLNLQCFLTPRFFCADCVLKWSRLCVCGSTSRSRTGKPKKVGGAIKPIKVAVLGGDFTSLSELGFP